MLLVLACLRPLAAADVPPLKLFEVPQVQLRKLSPGRSNLETNGAVSGTEMILQSQASAPVELLVQRYEAMNGSLPLRARPAPAGQSRFQRSLDSFLPRQGGFLQKNPNALSSPLSRSEYWTK